MISRLPPVGQRVPLAPLSEPPEFLGSRVVMVNSGTAALGLALRAAIGLRPSATHVILPAYGCPDLVAAAVFAGAVPVLVDCAPDDPGYNLDLLAAVCNERTAAVVAVNFLGIRENLPEIARICGRSGACLIEDCAQWYPEQASPVPLDAQVLSFGRGKPVNLMGGGALLLPNSGRLAELAGPSEPVMPPLGTLATRIFNLLLGKYPYGLVSRLPWLGVGETRYHQLRCVSALDGRRRALLSTAALSWTSQSRWREQELEAAVALSTEVEGLPAMASPRAGRLLRYPVLVRDAISRDTVYARLRRWGASTFYGQALAEIPDVASLVHVPGGYSQAESFAARLLTLPIHAGVSSRSLRAIARRL
jgi:dTDP-4-amino-4,6-dideoxygalactose transaminase